MNETIVFVMNSGRRIPLSMRRVFVTAWKTRRRLLLRLRHRAIVAVLRAVACGHFMGGRAR